MGFKRKDLLSISSLAPEEIQLILEAAEPFKEVSGREIKKVPALRGKTVVNLFFEPSTRTRTSFELAGKRLSADVINFTPPLLAALSKGKPFLIRLETLSRCRQILLWFDIRRLAPLKP